MRSTGALDVLTRQPVKGRKRGGGVRFGEMERDSLISHGTSFLLQDRILHGSDRTRCYLCRKCGNLLSPIVQVELPLAMKMLCIEYYGGRVLSG